MSVLVTVGVELVLNPSPSFTIPLLVSLLAVILTAYFAGRDAALFATAANLLVIWYLFAEPRFSFAVADAADRWRLAIFAAAGISVSLLSHRLSGTRHYPRVALMLVSSLLLIIVAVLVWFDFENARAAEAWVEHTYQVLNASERLLSGIEDADARQRGYLLTGEQQYLDRYRELLSPERAVMDQLRSLTGDNAAQQTRLRQLDRLIGARSPLHERGISARREGGIEAAITVLRTPETTRLTSAIRSELAAIESEEYRLLTQRTKAATEQAVRTRVILASGTAVLVALLIFAGVTIGNDVGKLRASATVLRRQADLLDKAHEPIIVWELGGAVRYWNHGAEQLYGIRRQEAVGRNHDDLLHPLHPLGLPAIEAQLARDGAWSGELTYEMDGREIIVESHMTLVTEPDGGRIVLKTNRDITQEKRAQQEIRQLNRELEERVKDRTEQLEASNKELEAFAYSVSHDLRAPLRGIDGWSMALLEDYGATFDPIARQYLDRVRAETQRMGHLIEDLLTLSRLTRFKLQPESVDLTSLARTIACRLGEAEPNRNIEFVIQEGLSTAGDAHLLDVALSNLMSNAVKFTSPRDLARIEFGRTNGQQETSFFVRDNGVGFDMAHAGMLFGAFQRLHKHGEFPGTGIGLATVQRVLRRHGGRIWADAKPGEGATFYFTIGDAASGGGEASG